MTSTNHQQLLENVSNWYSSYQGLNGFMIRCVYESFKPWLKPPILEIGAADGYMTHLIHHDFPQIDYEIVEASAQYAKKLSQNFPSIPVHNLYLEKYKTSKKYQTIIASHILEHVPYPHTFLNSIIPLLHKNGTLLLSVPNANSIHRLIGVEMGLIQKTTTLNEQDKKIGHFRVYDIKKLTHDIKRSDLKLVKIYGSFVKFLSNSQTETRIPQSEWEYCYRISKYFPNNCADICAICRIKHT